MCDLRDKINFSPSQGKYKIYIIDEVHMLSTAAFNALLKTLEEPPPHAILSWPPRRFTKSPPRFYRAASAMNPARAGGRDRRSTQSEL